MGGVVGFHRRDRVVDVICMGVRTDMSDELVMVLKELGNDGLTAFYVYLVLDYIGLYALIGLAAWGIRTIWKDYKDYKP